MTASEENARLLRLATTWSVATAGVLIVVKLVVWLSTGSVALLASLLDSLMDAAASVVNLLAVRYSLQPADEEHRFGHGKAESLAGLAQSAFIAGTAVLLVSAELDENLTNNRKLNVPGRPGGGQIYVTPRIQRLGQVAMSEAQSMGDEYISTEHIFLAVTSERNTPAARILAESGITKERLYEAIKEILGGQRVTDPQAETRCIACGASLAVAVLEVVRGNLPEKIRFLRSRSYTLGRARQNDIAFNEPSISKYHARLEYTDGRFFIEDAGSLHGLYVNAAKVRRAALSPGAQIQLGNVTLKTGRDTTPGLLWNYPDNGLAWIPRNVSIGDRGTQVCAAAGLPALPGPGLVPGYTRCVPRIGRIRRWPRSAGPGREVSHSSARTQVCGRCFMRNCGRVWPFRCAMILKPVPAYGSGWLPTRGSREWSGLSSPPPLSRSCRGPSRSTGCWPQACSFTAGKA